MGNYPVSAHKEKELLRWMEELSIVEEELTERFVRGSGKGGQKINKTSHCVALKHNPTGVEVRCQKDRSQAMNRFLARRLLCEKIEAEMLGKKSRAEQAREKIRRQKRKRSERAKRKMLEKKKQRGTQKVNRQKVKSPDE